MRGKFALRMAFASYLLTLCFLPAVVMLASVGEQKPAYVIDYSHFWFGVVYAAVCIFTGWHMNATFSLGEKLDSKE